MNPERLAAQLNFILEIDKLKTVIRQTYLTDKSRRENSAEHSWHLAMLAMTLAEYANEPIDLNRVIKLVLIHDIIEIDAGDTPAFDLAGNVTKVEREILAATRLFGLLPPGQQAEFQQLWEEFEAQETPDSHFALVLDRFHPLFHNKHTEGASWIPFNVSRAQVERRMQPIRDYSATLWAYVAETIEESVRLGYVREE